MAKMMIPNVPEKLMIDLAETAITFEPGHKIAVHQLPPARRNGRSNPNTGELFNTKPSLSQGVATNDLFHDKDHPSAIVLPVIYPGNDE